MMQSFALVTITKVCAIIHPDSGAIISAKVYSFSDNKGVEFWNSPSLRAARAFFVREQCLVLVVIFHLVKRLPFTKRWTNQRCIRTVLWMNLAHWRARTSFTTFVQLSLWFMVSDRKMGFSTVCQVIKCWFFVNRDPSIVWRTVRQPNQKIFQEATSKMRTETILRTNCVRRISSDRKVKFDLCQL